MTCSCCKEQGHRASSCMSNILFTHNYFLCLQVVEGERSGVPIAPLITQYLTTLTLSVLKTLCKKFRLPLVPVMNKPAYINFLCQNVYSREKYHKTIHGLILDANNTTNVTPFSFNLFEQQQYLLWKHPSETIVFDNQTTIAEFPYEEHVRRDIEARVLARQNASPDAQIEQLRGRQKAMDQMEVVQEKKRKFEEIDGTPVSCPICMFDRTGKEFIQFPCSDGHQVCQFCIIEMRAKQNGFCCPLCRAPIQKMKVLNPELKTLMSQSKMFRGVVIC